MARSRVVDVRYARYEGERGGEAAAVLSLARWSALRALGLRRGWKAKVVPIAVILAAFGPAIASLGIRALIPLEHAPFDFDQVPPYSNYLGLVSAFILVFAVVVTPDLLCPDRRDRVLDLYYPTAISPRRYLLAKLIAAIVPLALVTIVPLLVLYLGRISFAVYPLAYVQDHGLLPLRIVVAGGLVATYFAVLGLAIAALTSRRPFAMGSMAGVLLASSGAALVLGRGLHLGHGFQVLALPAVPIQLAEHLLGARRPLDPSLATWSGMYLLVMAISFATLLRRYRAADR